MSSRRSAEKCLVDLAMWMLEAGARASGQRVRKWRQHCGRTWLKKKCRKRELAGGRVGWREEIFLNRRSIRSVVFQG